MHAKAQFVAKSGREKRTMDRQKSRLLSKEDMERLQQLENKKVVRNRWMIDGWMIDEWILFCLLMWMLISRRTRRSCLRS